MKKKLLTFLLSVLMLATVFTTKIFAYTSATITVNFDTSKGSVTMVGGMKTTSPQTYVLNSIENNYSITLPANDIVQFDDEQDALSVAAVPKEGYVFSKWQLNGVDLTEDTTKTGDVTLTPIFVAGTPESLDVTISYDSTKGIVKNTNTQETVGNSTTFAMNCLTNNKFNILYDDEDPTWLNFYDKPMVNDYAIEAIANDNYRFVEWKVNSTKLTGSINLSVGAIIEAVFESDTPQTILASILPDDFPATFETGWKNNKKNGASAYVDSNEMHIKYNDTYGYYTSVDTSIVLTKVEEGIYKKGDEITFYVSDGVLYKIEVEPGLASEIDGTYEAPAPAASHDLTIEKIDGSIVPATEEVDYKWDETDDNKLIIKTNGVIVSGDTEEEYIEISEGVTSVTIKNLNIDLSSSSTIAIESKETTSAVNIKVDGNNSIIVGDGTKAGLVGTNLLLLGEGNLHIYGGHQGGEYDDNCAIFVEKSLSSSVNLLYLYAKNGIMFNYDNGESLEINDGNVFVLSDYYGIYGNHNKAEICINDANVNIYSGFSGVEANKLSIENAAQLNVLSEDGRAMGTNSSVFLGGKLTLSSDANMYITHCGGWYVNMRCGGGIDLPEGKKLKACKRALGRIEDCVDIDEDVSTYYDSKGDYSNTVYTIVFGNPSILQSEPVNFKTKVIGEDTIEVSGLVVPNVQTVGLSNGRWYYATDIEYYDELSCMNETQCIASDSQHQYHRMSHIAEGYATTMPKLIPLEVSQGKATISDIESSYVAIVYANEDKIKCYDSSNYANLAYGIGLAEISDWTIDSEINNANILVPDESGKIGERLPLFWCGEWELDNIYVQHNDYVLDEYLYNIYYIGTKYNGTIRTKGDLKFVLSPDSNYSFTGFESNSGKVEPMIGDYGLNYYVELGDKNYSISFQEGYDSYDSLYVYYYDSDDNHQDTIGYTFVKSDVERVNVNYEGGSVSIIKGDDIEFDYLPNLEKTGFVFGGWFSDSDCMKPLTMISEVEEDVTVYPKWFVKDEDTYFTSISGVIKVNGKVEEDVYYELYNSNIYLTDGYINSDGSFTWELPYAIAPGFYQLIIYPDNINGNSSYLLEIASNNVGTIEVNAKDCVFGYIEKYDEESFYSIAIGNFDSFSQAKLPSGTNQIMTNLYYSSYYIDSAIEEDMKQEAGDTDYFDYFDIGLSNVELTEDWQEVSGGPIYETDPTVLVIALAYPTNRRGDISILRYHDGDGDYIEDGTILKFDELYQRPTSNYQDGTFYIGENYILIYTSKFSTFGIASNDSIRYDILEEPTEPIIINNNEGATFKINVDYDKFFDGEVIKDGCGVKVDGEPIDSSKYTHESGSTIITLKSSYLNTLSVGVHRLSIIFEDGHADTTFVVASNRPTPSPEHRREIPNTGVSVY